MAGVADIDENVIEATIEIDFKSYSSSRLEALKEAVDKLTLENSPPEIIQDALSQCRSRNFNPSILCIAACELVGGSVELAMPTACAIAILETLSVIQRELVMDTADLEKTNGKATAVLAANAFQALAYEHVATAMEYVATEMEYTEDKSYTIAELIGMMGRYLEAALVREALILYAQESALNLRSLPETIFECSAVVGASAGGGSRVQMAWIAKFGRRLGQIVDTREARRQFSPNYMKHLVRKTKKYILIGHESGIPVFDREKAAPLLALVDYLAFG